MSEKKQYNWGFLIVELIKVAIAFFAGSQITNL